MDKGKQVNKPKVSVIMPVYNTEEYVEEALRSIMNQTLKEIEIIIIDDGSTDSSLSVIKELASKDPRIQYFSQVNKGQSVARNAGIEKATGEYLYFMDSDDILEDVAFELCYHRCASEQLDFVFFDAKNFGEISKSIVEYDRKKQLDNQVYSGIEFLNILLDKAVYRVTPWLYFINFSFLQKQNIIFDSKFRIYEDQIFSARLYLSASRIAYIPISLFHRRLRQNSLMTNPYSLYHVETYFMIAEELTNIGRNGSKEEQHSISRIVKEMLNAAIYMAHKLIISERMIIGAKVFKNYPCYISLKTWIVLFFPQSIAIKSSLK